MRIPFKWTVLAAFPLVLLADPVAVDPRPRLTDLPQLQASQPSPFAYVREDGTEIHVPATGSAEIPDIDLPEPAEDAEEGEARDYHRAVYTWSSPVFAGDSDRPAVL